MSRPISAMYHLRIKCTFVATKGRVELTSIECSIKLKVEPITSVSLIINTVKTRGDAGFQFCRDPKIAEIPALGFNQKNIQILQDVTMIIILTLSVSCSTPPLMESLFGVE